MKSSISVSAAKPRRRSEQGYVISALVALRRLKVPCAWEAALMGRSVDLAYMDGDAVCTVEFKRCDWRRALAQARDHLIGADFAYICLAEQTATPAFVEAAGEAGIGILSISNDNEWPFHVVVAATRSTDTWIVARERLVQQLRSQ